MGGSADGEASAGRSNFQFLFLILEKYKMLGQARVGLLGWFVYPLLNSSGAALTLSASIGAQATGIIQILQNADFELHQIQFFDTASASTNGQFSVKFGMGNATVVFMNDWVLVPNIFGQGNLPHILREPFVFPRGTIIDVNFRNETATSRTLYFAFEGINVEVTQ